MIARRVVDLPGPVHLGDTLGPLRHGRGDGTAAIGSDEAWWATRFDDGLATVRLRLLRPDRAEASAWGDAAERILDAVPDLLGAADAPDALVVEHPILRTLQRRHAGLRLPRTGRAFHGLVPAVFEQKVTGTEAFRAYAALLRRYGERAPGPARLVAPPAATVLAGLPYHAFHPLGIERRRAEVVRAAARRATWIEAASTPAEATARLTALPGIGAWTAAEVVRVAHGDPDAISVGDYHLPNIVAWALAGEPRADDARMLELLEPYRGQRGRVQRLLEVGRVTAPRYGPRTAPRRIAAI